MRRKIILSEEEDYRNNPDCQNCPYFINKLRCPFHRKREAEVAKPYSSGTTVREEE